MVYDRICFSGEFYKYNLKFKDRITLVTNESGGGKTLLYNALKAYALAEGKNDMVFKNYNDVMSDDLADQLLKPDIFYVVDDATLLVDSRLAFRILFNKSSQYLIFTTRSDVYKYKPAYINLAELKGKKTVTLSYPLLSRR